MTLASSGDADGINQCRPENSSSRLRRTLEQQDNDPFKDQELFAKHLLRETKENGSDAIISTTHDLNYLETNTRSNMLADNCSSDDSDNIDDLVCDRDDSDEDSSEAIQMAVVTAEEYAAKIIKLQQACLIPLKEDLADWLNKILKTSHISSTNFMDKLDNGVIICRLAKIISLWCKQQLENQDNNVSIYPSFIFSINFIFFHRLII